VLGKIAAVSSRLTSLQSFVLQLVAQSTSVPAEYDRQSEFVEIVRRQVEKDMAPLLAALGHGFQLIMELP